MDVELKLEVDETDIPISPSVIKADLFDTQAGYGYDIHPHEMTSQQICGVLSKDSRARDVEIKAESIGLTTIVAQDTEITDNVLVSSINSVSQAVGVKRVILITNVEGKHVIVHTEQDNPSTSVKDESCFEPSETQIGNVFGSTVSQSPLSAAESACSGGQIDPTAHLEDYNLKSKKTNWQFFVNASKRIHLEHCNKVGVDFNVGSGEKQKLDLKLLTNGVMIEISDLAKYFRTSQHVICDILEYNFDLCLQSDQRREFASRTNRKVTYLMTLTKFKVSKPGLLTQVFELPMTMTVSKTRYSCVKHSNDIVSANQRLKKDVEIQQLVIKKEEECVPIMSFEEDRLVEYEKAEEDNTDSLMNFDLDASQVSHHVKETMSNETDVSQSAVETATLALKNGPTNICIKDEPNLDLVSTQHVKMETISTDTDVSLFDDEAVHRPTRDLSFMSSATEDKTMDLYPLCKKIGLDLDVKSIGEAKEKLDLCLLTKGAMIEVGHFAKKVYGTYRQIISDVLVYNFDVDLQKDKDLIKNIILNLRLVEKKTRPNFKGMLSKEKHELLQETLTIVPPKKRKYAVISGDMVVTRASAVSKDQRLKEVTKRRRLDLMRKKEERETFTARKMKADQFERARQVSQCVKTESVFTETDSTQCSDETAILGHENGSADICIKEETDLDFISLQDVEMKTINTETDVIQCNAEAVHRRVMNQSLMVSTVKKTAALPGKSERRKKSGQGKFVSNRKQKANNTKEVKYQTMANDICSVNDSKITELSQPSAGGNVEDPYPNCKKIGVDFHVGSGAKQKLDIGLLTNGVMTEVSHFAEEMNRSHAHVICDILDYNFDLGLQNDQRHDFAIRTMAKVKFLMEKPRLQRPDLITKVFELPDPRAIPVSKTHVSSNLLNDIVSFNLRLNKDVEIQQDNTVSLMNFDLDASQVSPHHVKETMSNETDVETATLALKNGPTNVCIKDEPNLDLVSTQHVKISTDTDVSLSDEEAVHRPTRDKSFMTSATEDKTTDLYPLCKKIGLDLDVKSKGEGKEKLDFRLLTRGVMVEVAKFAADVCGTYRQIVSAVLEYNFDLDFPKNIDLLENIIHNLTLVKKKMKIQSWRLKGKKGELELLKEKFSMAPHWKRSGISNVTKERPLDYRRKNKKREALIAKKMQEDKFETARQVPQSIKTEKVFTETDATRFADETAILGRENRSADIFITEESDRQSGVIEQASDSENNQVNICWTYIHKILMCKNIHWRRWIFSKFKNCFGYQIGSENNFKPILAKYRSDVLPLIVEKYDGFSHAEKTIISLVNQLFCGLHLIDGLAHQAKTTLLLWEKMILGEKEVGVHSSPNIRTVELESGTVRLGNTVSDAVQEQRWGMDSYLVPFKTFLASKGEFDEVPLSPSSGNRIDSLFHNAAGVYSIHDDIIVFNRDYEDESSMLAAVAAGLEIQPFKAGCRALGLISKIIIDPLWRALTLNESVLDMEVRYRTLVTKLKEWQEDGRDLVEGNVRLFDDIEVPKDLVFDRLTMWTDTDFFQLTVQIVELLLASFLRVCCKMLPVDLQQMSKINDRCRKDLEISEQLLKAKANSISIAVEAMGMCKKNHTWEWLSFLDAPKIVSVLKALQIV